MSWIFIIGFHEMSLWSTLCGPLCRACRAFTGCIRCAVHYSEPVLGERESSSIKKDKNMIG